MLTDNLKAFVKPLLNNRETVDHIEAIERVSGRPADVASTVATELSKDMQTATHYPPAIASPPSAADLAGRIYAVAENISRKVEEEKAKKDEKK